MVGSTCTEVGNRPSSFVLPSHARTIKKFPDPDILNGLLLLNVYCMNEGRVWAPSITWNKNKLSVPLFWLGERGRTWFKGASRLNTIAVCKIRSPDKILEEDALSPSFCLSPQRLYWRVTWNERAAWWTNVRNDALFCRYRHAMYWVTNYRNDDQPAKRGGLVAHKHSTESIDQRTLEREPYRDQLQTIVHLLRFIQVLIPRRVLMECIQWQQMKTSRRWNSFYLSSSELVEMRAHVRRIFQVNRACGHQALSKYSREVSLVEIPDTENIQKNY